MAKRTSNNVVQSPPKEKKSPKFDMSLVIKREIEYSDSDSEQFEEPVVEAEETRHAESALHYEPDEFKILLDSFNEFLQASKFSSLSVHNVEKAVVEWQKTQNGSVDDSNFTSDYRMHFRQAVKFRHCTLQDASLIQKTYLNGEKSLSKFPSFPVKPPTKFQLYVKKNHIELKGINGGAMKTVYEKMNEDEEGCRVVEEELQQLNERYIPQLQEFLDSHPKLSDDQKKHLENKIRVLREKINAKGAAHKTPKSQLKSKKETAFTLFCKSKGDKYRDMPNDDREKTLKKQFSKLPVETRELFKDLAANLQ